MVGNIFVIGSKLLLMLTSLAFLGQARKHSEESDLCNVLTDLGFAICMVLIGLLVCA